MSATRFAPPREPAGAFRHEALFYAGVDGFVEHIAPFISDGVDAGEPVFVVVSQRKIDLLRARLGPTADAVRFADMAEVGANPARIIPAWQEFVSEHADGGRRLRGVGEPVSADRSAAEVLECQQHEQLLNVAFADTPPWVLLCPYDTTSLDRAVLAEARRTHPFVRHDEMRGESADYREDGLGPRALDMPLPEPPAHAWGRRFGAHDLEAVRAVIAEFARSAGLEHNQAADFVLAVNEAATNSLRHGGGRGQLRVWDDEAALVCEISDPGRVDYPLAGREHPDLERGGGRGLWMVNQLCDLVQLRSSAAGTVVRMHARRD